MDFVEATNVLNGGPTLTELADELGVTAVSLSRARTARANRFYRPPPDGWETVVAELAREQAERLHALADRLSTRKKPARRSKTRRSSRKR